jgi:nitrite reductase/ring-hydroxylating ferredoxin subunit
VSKREHQARALVERLSTGAVSRREFVRRASALGLSGAAVATFLAACGGEEEAAQPAPAEPPAEPAPAEPPAEPAAPPAGGIPAADVAEGQLAAFDVDGTKVAVANVGGEFFAFSDTCTHQGCSLSTGTLEDGNVICPCHGSTFAVETGEVIRGPAESPVASYPVEVVGDQLEISVS